MGKQTKNVPVHEYNMFLNLFFQVPYFWAGIKAYDLVSGSECLKSSYFLNKGK